ncbi:hypothetical protein L228DRAFT_249931 [Xylona heveae TC161]|uniref:UBA domain-containing protein n=1 Tax=Xylona heveae (strain CBS 132557 / TC161) TaxID=1328760 RepID=A0A165ACI8_XYLHT|nr:hypothetical protein L228DRAFT_249931 [Xylona heveae TC161]KZF20252.1 hypothetical protein L228DRAFT_249931 [Xylona heveae TC161]
MDDLAGLSWKAGSLNDSNKPNTTNFGALYGVSRPTPPPAMSGRSTPLSNLASGSRTGLSTGTASSTKSNTPVNDSFSNLVSFGRSKSPNNLSLQERQKRLQEQKAKDDAEQRKLYDAHFGVDNQFWSTLESGKGTPTSTAASIHTPPASSGTPLSAANIPSLTQMPLATLNGDKRETIHSAAADGDLLAAFSSAAPVDASSHFPPPPETSASPADASISRASPGQAEWSAHSNLLNADDDDPFGLGHPTRQERQTAATPVQAGGGNDDDDVLGLLGKPVSELVPPKKQSPPPVREEEEHEGEPPLPASGLDREVAELVDMGFPAKKARQAVEATGNDIQSAVGWLLNKAHEEARQKTLQKPESRTRSARQDNRSTERETDVERRHRDGRETASMPAWMKPERRGSPAQRVSGDNTPGESDKDIAQYASEIGVSLFKSANTLWKTGQRRVQAAVADFHHETDPSQPKWMRDAQIEAQMHKKVPSRHQGQREHSSRADNGKPDGLPPRPNPVLQKNMTDEALMLESGDSRPQSRTNAPYTRRAEARSASPSLEHETKAPAARDVRSEPLPSQPRFLQQRQERRPASKLSRQAVEEQSAQAYISPARRRKAAPKVEAEEPDLLGSGGARSKASAPTATPPPLQSNNPFLQKSTAGTTASSSSSTRTSTPLPTRPKALPRQIPQISPQVISDSAAHRGKGTDAFKRGDYALAHESYSRALSPLPQTHPIAIIVLCNRALTNLKIGDPKASVADADLALSIIGVSRGAGETIDLGNGEAHKDMAEFYGKALMRKAEALEQMERWKEAGSIWREAVAVGVGGATSIQGRNRCDKALGGDAGSSRSSSRPSAPAVAPRRAAASSAGTPVARPSTLPAKPSAAVNLLRAANAAAEKADDEKFALADQVEARILAWRGGKQDNLRALIGSLDTVLWPEAGWKKVGMHELVMPNKVKIAYMKGIAKVHPDKLSTSATTEQRMISAAVFSTLNEAWDKFKKENNL